MTKDMTLELLETIKATLPETQVGLIKEALVERDDLKFELKDLESEFDSEKERREKLFKEFKELEAKQVSTEALLELEKSRSAQLKAENENLVYKDVQRQADLAYAELRGVQTTQQLFLKNTIVREKVQHQVTNEGQTVQTQYVNGQQVAIPTTYKTNVPVTDIKEVEQDVEKAENEQA